ncbi:hypothetical protein [Promicromonospora soli]
MSGVLQHPMTVGRIEDRISELQRTLARIDAYETDHDAELTGQIEGRWMGGPRTCPHCA